MWKELELPKLSNELSFKTSIVSLKQEIASERMIQKIIDTKSSFHEEWTLVDYRKCSISVLQEVFLLQKNFHFRSKTER